MKVSTPRKAFVFRRQPVAHALAAAGMILATPLFAHETWLMPDSFHPAANSSVSLSMTSGMAFPALGSGITRSRIQEAVLSQNGDRRPLVPEEATSKALELVATPDPGVACAWVSLKPRILEIKPDAVAHYLEEIGATESVWAAWNNQAEPKFWKESYSKLARSYLHSPGDSAMGSSDAACWTDKSTSRLEILPLSNPTALSAGDDLTLRVLLDGEPLAGQAVGLLQEGSEPNVLKRSGANGELTLSFAGNGRHMIYATNLRPQSGDDFNWQSNFVTLTLQVGDDS